MRANSRGQRFTLQKRSRALQPKRQGHWQHSWQFLEQSAHSHIRNKDRLASTVDAGSIGIEIRAWMLIAPEGCRPALLKTPQRSMQKLKLCAFASHALCQPCGSQLQAFHVDRTDQELGGCANHRTARSCSLQAWHACPFCIRHARTYGHWQKSAEILLVPYPVYGAVRHRSCMCASVGYGINTGSPLSWSAACYADFVVTKPVSWCSVIGQHAVVHVRCILYVDTSRIPYFFAPLWGVRGS